MERTWAKVPCKHCPFRTDVRPFLHPERAADIAYSSTNPYSDFPCHKTVDYSEEDEEGDAIPRCTNATLTCAGFLTMQISEAGIEPPEGFEPASNCYDSPHDMWEAYRDQWSQER